MKNTIFFGFASIWLLICAMYLELGMPDINFVFILSGVALILSAVFSNGKRS